VGAEDADLLVTRDIFPLSESFAAVRRASTAKANIRISWPEFLTVREPMLTSMAGRSHPARRVQTPNLENQ